jgi:hypothetical protein
MLEEAGIIPTAIGGQSTSRGWLIFSSRANGIRIEKAHLFKIQHRMRIAFADAVKHEVHSAINASRKKRKEEPLEDAFFETNKDMKIDIYTGRSVTMRDFYIKCATNRRGNDPTYWTNRAMASIIEVDAASGERYENEVFDVTDWRFTNELHYVQAYAPKFNILTTRIFRNSVVTPESHVASEHDLDTTLTDALLVGSRRDALCALIRWPMYAYYSFIGVIE